MKAVVGVHVTAIGWEERVEEILSGVGFLPRLQVA